MTSRHSLTRLALVATLGGCSTTRTISPADVPGDTTVPVALQTDLSFTSALARTPMVDTTRVAGVEGGVALIGLLNQTAPCFGLTSAATREASRVVVRLMAKQVDYTCNTLAAGALDYDVGVKGLSAGTYDVQVLHRTEFRDGRVVEAKVGERRVEVK